MNVSALLTGVAAVSKSVAANPITKGGSLAALITGGLTIAAATGLAVPSAAFTLGPIAGLLLYRMLPKRMQEQLDETAEKITNIDNLIPEIKTYPADDRPDKPRAKTNLKDKRGNPLNGG